MGSARYLNGLLHYFNTSRYEWKITWRQSHFLESLCIVERLTSRPWFLQICLKELLSGFKSIHCKSSAIQIKNILKILNISALDLIRKEEKIFKENYKNKYISSYHHISEILISNKNTNSKIWFFHNLRT